MVCTLDGGLKQRTGNSLLYSLERFVVALCLADTDMGDTLVGHNGLNICEVEVDECRQVDQVCDAPVRPAAEPRLLSLMPPAWLSGGLRFQEVCRSGSRSGIYVFLEFSIPISALLIRVLASEFRNGFVTTPTVRMPISFGNACYNRVLHLFRFRRPYRR